VTNADIYAALMMRWRDNPIAFAHEALGIERIWSRQADLLRAVAAHRKVAVRSGQKTSKTFSIAIAAIWWALTRPRARVVLMSPSARQIRENLWTDITRIREDTYDRSVRHLDGRPRVPALLPLGGDFHISPETGWTFDNGSKIVGFVSNDPEKLRGLSGPDQFYIPDEASGIPDAIFASIDGNLAGGGRILAISNPVHSNGWYRECFEPSNAARVLEDGSEVGWHQIAISSIEASEVEPPIPGLATKQFIAEKRSEWGTNSRDWHAKILGEFPPETADGVIPRSIVDKAAARWTTTPQTEDALQIGVDVARFGRDKSAIVWRRGPWASAPIVLDGCDVVEVADRVVETIDDVRRPNEKARVLIDAVSVGGGVADILRRRPDICEVVDVQAAGTSPDPACSRMRDAIWMRLKKWLEEDGAIPRDVALIADVTAPMLGYDPQNRYKVEDKRSMGQRLGRSTDRADALALAVYDNASGNANDDLIFGGRHKMPRSDW
jgi:phage terminase large subunit